MGVKDATMSAESKIPWNLCDEAAVLQGGMDLTAEFTSCGW